jgi:hypothetical protein
LTCVSSNPIGLRLANVAEHVLRVGRFGMTLVDIDFSLRLDFGDATFEESAVNNF